MITRLTKDIQVIFEYIWKFNSSDWEIQRQIVCFLNSKNVGDNGLLKVIFEYIWKVTIRKNVGDNGLSKNFIVLFFMVIRLGMFLRKKKALGCQAYSQVEKEVKKPSPVKNKDKPKQHFSTFHTRPV